MRVKSWNLLGIATPDGSRSPVVLHSGEGSRVVLISLDPGQELGDHQVKERAFVAVVDGTVRVEGGGSSHDAKVGDLFMFDPDERHSLASDQGARILLVLAPWPGEGHYRGNETTP